jgi:hypothetical protein
VSLIALLWHLQEKRFRYRFFIDYLSTDFRFVPDRVINVKKEQRRVACSATRVTRLADFSPFRWF